MPEPAYEIPLMVTPLGGDGPVVGTSMTPLGAARTAGRAARSTPMENMVSV
jgi:hypothetical protein